MTNLVGEVSQRISATFGLRARSDWPAEIQRVIAGAGGNGRARELLSDQRRCSELLEQVARRITVGETHFFRHRSQLEHAAEHLLHIGRKEQRKVRAWSAGCASGEEPYSLAILLEQTLRARLPETVEIVGSDVNPDVVQKARDAVYTSWSFRGTPPWVLAHFTVQEPRSLRLSTRELLDTVSFEVASCQARAERQSDGALDLVLFRNVAIYLESAASEALYREFARLLRPGGMLALGPADPRPPLDCFEQVRGEHAPAYRRRARSAAPVSPPTPPTKRERPARREADRALDVAETLGAAEPDSPTAQRLLGQARLDLGRPEEALTALRRALFLDPLATIARCFYAQALFAAGEPTQALLQLQLLINKLGTLEPEQLLEDGETTAAELLAAALFLRGEWQ